MRREPRHRNPAHRRLLAGPHLSHSVSASLLSHRRLTRLWRKQLLQPCVHPHAPSRLRPDVCCDPSLSCHLAVNVFNPYVRSSGLVLASLVLHVSIYHMLTACLHRFTLRSKAELRDAVCTNPWCDLARYLGNYNRLSMHLVLRRWTICCYGSVIGCLHTYNYLTLCTAELYRGPPV